MAAITFSTPAITGRTNSLFFFFFFRFPPSAQHFFIQPLTSRCNLIVPHLQHRITCVAALALRHRSTQTANQRDIFSLLALARLSSVFGIKFTVPTNRKGRKTEWPSCVCGGGGGHWDAFVLVFVRQTTRINPKGNAAVGNILESNISSNSDPTIYWAGSSSQH